jgi:hypothetical protein
VVQQAVLVAVGAVGLVLVIRSAVWLGLQIQAAAVEEKIALDLQAAAVLSLCALRVPTLPLTVQLQSVEHERERTPLVRPHTIISRLIRQAR